MSGELEVILQDVKPSKGCPVCKKDVFGGYQEHVQGCSFSMYDGIPQTPRSPQSKKRLHESISQCRRKFRGLESPIRAQIIGSLRRLACNSSKMCPTELSSPPKRPLSPRALSSKEDPISRLDDSVIGMIFAKKEEHIAKEYRSKKRKPEPSLSVSSPLQDFWTDKKQRASPTSPPALGVLTPRSSTPSPSLPTLPETPETPTDSLPSSPERSTPPSTPHLFGELSTWLPDVDEPEFDHNALFPLQIGESSTQGSTISPPKKGGISQFANFSGSAPAQSSTDSLSFIQTPTIPSFGSSKQVHYLEEEDENESTFNFDTAPSYSPPQCYSPPSYSSPAITSSERDFKAEGNSVDKIRFFILQHQQLLAKAEHLLGSFQTDSSKLSMGPWLPPEVNDIHALTRQLDQIAHFTSQRLQQIANAAKIHEYMQSSLPSTTPARHPFQPVSLAAHLAHYGRYERDFEFLVKTVQNRRSEALKRLVDQIVEPQ